MEKRFNKKRNALIAIKNLVIIILVSITMWMFLNYDSENHIKNKDGYFAEKVSVENGIDNKKGNEIEVKKINIYDNVNETVDKKNNEISQNIETNVPKSEQKIVNEYKGYSVIAQLKIPKINLETYVLSSYNESALLISTTKFWGGEPNTVGNFCISGHNYINKNMFHNLKKLTIGDEIFLSTNKTGTLTYIVYDIYKVYPNETECLSQNTNGKKEVTLITCTSDSKKRIIVKAREKEV